MKTKFRLNQLRRGYFQCVAGKMVHEFSRKNTYKEQFSRVVRYTGDDIKKYSPTLERFVNKKMSHLIELRDNEVYIVSKNSLSETLTFSNSEESLQFFKNIVEHRGSTVRKIGNYSSLHRSVRFKGNDIYVLVKPFKIIG